MTRVFLAVTCTALLSACTDLGPGYDGEPSFKKNGGGPSADVITVVPSPGFEFVMEPATFVRSPGPPRTETMVVTHPDFGEFQQPLTLHFINGMDDGSARTNNATVTLAGAEVFSSESFSKDTPAGEIDVSMSDGQVLTVRVNASPGGTVTVWVEGQRNANPPHH